MNKSRFIEALEIIYALFFAVGLYNVLDKFKGDFFYLSSLILCIAVMIRFFFAPSKNVETMQYAIYKSNLTEQEKEGSYRLLFLGDVTVLFIHAVLFVIMCNYITKVKIDDPRFEIFRTFFFLLLLNAFWLLSIEYRVKKLGQKCERFIKYWYTNNFRCSVAILIVWGSSLLLPSSWHPIVFALLLICAYLNCILDLWNTYDAYLFHTCYNKESEA